MVLWQDIAEALRAGIARGEYPPGSTIPKETELMAAHGTGRDPVRRAIAQLTAEGLVEPVRRRGTVVRHHPARRRINRSRLVYRDELGYYFDQTAQSWRPVQSPTVSRGPVPYDIAALLDLQSGAEVIIRDRVMGDPATGQATQLATSYIPAALAEELPVLSATETGSGGIYDRLEDAGHGPIRWTEAITSRMPGPVEARRCFDFLRECRYYVSCGWLPALPGSPWKSMTPASTRKNGKSVIPFPAMPPRVPIAAWKSIKVYSAERTSG